MSERYQKLFALSENLYAESAPLLIAAGALFCAAAVAARGGGQSGTAVAAAVRAAASARRGGPMQTRAAAIVKISAAHGGRFLRCAPGRMPPAWRSYFPERRADYGKKEKGTIHD